MMCVPLMLKSHENLVTAIKGSSFSNSKCTGYTDRQLSEAFFVDRFHMQEHQHHSNIRGGTSIYLHGNMDWRLRCNLTNCFE